MITDHGFSSPSEVWNRCIENRLYIDDYDEEISKELQKIGQKRGVVSNSKARRTKNCDEINELANEIKLLQKYRTRIKSFTEANKTMDQGLKYTQPKSSAYKIKSNGQYGDLMIDLPKLIGQLRLVATKNGKKVLDQQADFDTIDL